MRQDRSVRHVHHLADLLERAVGDGVGTRVAVEHVAHGGRVGGQFAAALTQAAQMLVDRFGDGRLESGAAEVADLVGDVGGIAAAAQGGGQQQAGDLRAVLGVVSDRAQGVGLTG